MILFADSFNDYGSIYERYDNIVNGAQQGSFGINTNVPSPSGPRCLVYDDEVTSFPFQNTHYAGKNIPASVIVGVGFRLLVNTGGRTPPDVAVFSWFDGASVQVDLRLTSSGTFYFTRNGTQLGAPVSSNFTFNAWHYIEAQVTINNTTGSVILRVDGATVINLTNQNTRTSTNNQVTQCGPGTTLSPASNLLYKFTAWADLVIWDTTGSINNTFLGDLSVKAYAPTGLGALNQFAPTAVAWPTSTVQWIGRRIKDSNNNIQEVTSCTSDCKTGGSAPAWNVTVGGTTLDNHVTWTNRGADSSFLEVSELVLMGLNDRCAGKAVPIGHAIVDPNLNVQMVTTAGTTANGGSPAWSTIVGNTSNESGGVVWTCQGPLANFEDMYLLDATVGDQTRFTYPGIVASSIFAAIINMRIRKDDAATRAVRGVAKSGATTGTSPTDLVMSTTYQFQQGILETDPNTGAAWTQTALNAAELGVKVTI